jgi:hypothetical protein
MTLGPRIVTAQRRAGLSLTWGRTVQLAGLPAGELIELVRASIGGPVAWSVSATADGMTLGDSVNVLALPGLGQAVARVPLGSLSSVTPLLSAPPGGIPAGELVISLRLPLALLTGSVTVVVCPATWPHWASPTEVNPR